MESEKKINYKDLVKSEKWGFVRETKEKASEAGIDKDTGLKRTGLDEYLAVIYPEISKDEWIHDKTVPECKKKIRPDYRCESLKIIIEFDGLQHYTNPSNILKDIENTKLYEDLGYKVIRIPYFIQLSNDVIKSKFNREVNEKMFNPKFPSLGVLGENTPAYLC